MSEPSAATYRLGDWSTNDAGDARMRARKDAVDVLPALATFQGETSEQAVRAHWDSQTLHYSIDYLALVVTELSRQVNRSGGTAGTNEGDR